MNKKLHILFLSGWYPSKVLPTNGDFIQRHAEAVNTLHKVTVVHIISNPKNDKSFIIEKEVTNGVTTYIAYIRQTNNPILKVYLFLKVFKKILKQITAIDMVHLNILYPFGIFALYLKWFYKLPFIISEHSTAYLKNSPDKQGFIKQALSKRIAKNATFICPVSLMLKNAMLIQGLQGNYYPIGNVVDTNLFKPTNTRSDGFSIVHISSHKDVHKNISGMLKVAKKLENKIGAFTWKFIGSNGEPFKKLIEELDFKEASIIFLGHLTQPEFLPELQQAHAFVSFSNYETFSLVVFEALACGTPVISTNVGALKELKSTDYLSIITPKDEDVLITHLLSIKENSQVNTKEMHEFVAKKYSPKIIANQFSELYFKSLKN